jgi:hypothetical protein
MVNPTGLSGVLIAGIFLVVLMYRAAPQLIAVMDAAVPVIVAIGAVVAVLRVVWFYTRTW